MKKSVVIILVLLLVILIYIFLMLLNSIFKIPQLSPFFPDLAPFDATVTIISNNAPLIIDLDNEIFICEGNFTSHFFNVSDNDANLASVGISPSFPTSPFFVRFNSLPLSDVIEGAEIFSAVLDKSWVDRNLGYKTYAERISAVDMSGLSDFKDIDITVLEINHEPNASNIGVQTVWTRGDDRTFYHQVSVIDIEDGNQNAGNLVFNLTFLDNSLQLFNISNTGVMNFTPNESEINLSFYSLGVYNLSLCVKDMGLIATHSRLAELCGAEQDGMPFEVCQNFSLTITNENRPPNITLHYPENLSFNVLGTRELYFNITDKDPDGTIPDTYWYVDDNFIEYDAMSSFDEFVYAFGCGVSGNHNVRVDVTDGLLNDSIEWEIDVGLVSCPSPPAGGGGGGGGSITRRCEEKWGCGDFRICQNLTSSFEGGLVGSEDFRTISDNCRLDNFADNCGLQLRSCIDVNSCNSTLLIPEEVQHCYYVENPSCFDSVKNCHSGGCELLVDCGGPCGACPTCSDGIENQGEGGVDCGGPCPIICEERPPIYLRAGFFYSLMFLVLLLLIIVIIQLIRIYRARRKMKTRRLLMENVNENVSGNIS